MSDTGIIKVENKIVNSKEQNIETIMKRIRITTTSINKMKRISSLFTDEMGGDLKESEKIAFFFEKSFDAFLKCKISGVTPILTL